jgi:hypothetical protein
MRTLKDIRGVNISKGDTVSIATDKFNEKGAMHDITVVEDVIFLENKIIVHSGEDVDIGTYEVLVLPDGWGEGV